MRKLETGFSIYLSIDIEDILKVIQKAKVANCKYVFTSLNILEEKLDKIKKVNQVISLCNENNLNLIIDINSLSKNMIDIKNENIYLRIDDGLSLDEIIELSSKYNIVLNASTVNEDDLNYLKNNNIDFSKVFSLHNYYPKRFTGIGEKYLLEQNLKYHKFGIKTMAFVKGDNLRGPMVEGLPTLESHRNYSFKKSVLDLFKNMVDIVLIGDNDIDDKNWQYFKYFSENIMPLKNMKNILTNQIFEDRKDYSEYVIRSMIPKNIGTTRKEFLEYIEKNVGREFLNKINNEEIKKGDILISNFSAKRYEGELEIALKNIGKDETRSILTKVCNEDLELLEYISIFKRFLFY